MKRFFIFFIFTCVLFSATPHLPAEEKLLYFGFEPPLQSKAYEQFQLRPRSDLSKLIYLIDRFVDSKIQVQYEKHYYPAFFAARIARAFLPAHYKNEKPEAWVMQWCSTSFPSGDPIWMKFPDGSFKLGREVMIDELKLLDQILEAESLQKQDFA